MIIFPLTYDENDSSETVALSKPSACPGPLTTPEGFKGNGYDAKYYTSIDATGLDTGLLASIKPSPVQRSSSADIFVTLAPSSTPNQPRLELVGLPTPEVSNLAQVNLRYYTTSLQAQPLNRSTWAFECRFPEVCKPQALVFLSSDRLLVSAHFNEEYTTVYEYDIPTKTFLRSFTTTLRKHIGSFAFDSQNRLWATDSSQGYCVFEINLQDSFSTGSLVTNQYWDVGDLQANGGIAFANGKVFLQEYRDIGTTGYLYVYSESQMTGAVTTADRVARYNTGLRVQDICIRQSDGNLYCSRNTIAGASAPSGFVQVYSVSAMLSLADGSTPSTIVTQHSASRYPEGIDFHPVTDVCYTTTEGRSSTGDDHAFLSIWKSALDGRGQLNHYNIASVNGSVTVLINNSLFRGIYQSTSNLTLSIGGPISGTSGYCSDTVIRNVAISDEMIDEFEAEEIHNGSEETEVLIEQELILVNPGAETGNTSGWTDELSGALAIRSTNPIPSSGNYYFMSTGGVNNRSRQAINLPSGVWNFARIEWEQSSYDGASDPGGCGMRLINSMGATISQFLSPEVIVSPSQTWTKRSLSVPITSLTASLQALQHRTRTAGTNVDCNIDNITVKVYSK